MVGGFLKAPLNMRRFKNAVADRERKAVMNPRTPNMAKVDFSPPFALAFLARWLSAQAAQNLTHTWRLPDIKIPG